MEDYSCTVIHEEANKQLLLLKQPEEEQFFVAKMLLQEFPNPTELLQLENELEVTRSLAIPEVRKAIRREFFQNRHALILEYFNGETLHGAFLDKKQPLTVFLRVAIQIAHTLGLLHRHNIIHKDINKFNILVNLNANNIKIIDFEISSRIDVKKRFVGNPEHLEGTLAYISPEQTGRMNRRLDYRSDLYSLGITFYEILTGKLPFTATDVLELVHLHIAQTPQPPHLVNPDIPEVLSEIILKLLSKNAEDRYQTAFGLQKDLEICLTHLEKQGSIPHFPIAKEDFSGQLQVVQKLYGREEELTTLLTAFHHISKGNTKLIMVEGQPGVGKSALVHEVHKPITEKHGFFIEGKFDQLQRNIPFFAFTQAFAELVNILLTESDTELQYWKQKITKAVGDLGKIVTDLIPSLELIIGKQPDVPKLGATETQNRLIYVFRNFINEFCNEDHPFVLFLDDLQWADSGSLLLLSNLLNNPESGYFLIIGAYRNNEVDAAHPLMTTLEAIGKAGMAYATIQLNNLTKHNVTDLIADTLQSSRERTTPLAHLIHKKTQGNPFFINQFMKTIYEEGLLFFNARQTIWEWKEKEILSLTSTDNVVALLATKAQKLPAATQEVLKYAACIGNRFELTTLSILLDKSPAAINKDLFPALLEGLIMPRDNSFMIEEVTDERLLQQAAYYFIHDKIQQAVYSLIPDEQKKQVHLTVGRLLLQHAENETAIEEEIFDIIYHINQGLDLIDNGTEKIRYAELNARAGFKAKKSSAFKPAFDFYATAIKLISDHPWQTQYALSLELFTEGAETAYLNGDTKTMNLWLAEVFTHANEALDLVKAYNIKIDAETSENRLPDALETGVEVLDKLGVHFPSHPKTMHILLALAKTQVQMMLKKIENIPSLPPMKDPYKLEAMPILQRLIPAAFMSGSNLFPLIVFKMVRLSLKYGNAEPSALGYASFAITQTGILGNIEIGSRLGKISMEVLNKFYSENYKVKVLFTLNNFIRHWKEPLRDVVDPLLESYHLGLKVGDLVGGTWSAYYRLLNKFYYGENLVNLEEEINIYTSVFAQYKQQAALDRTNLLLQLVLNLRGKNTNPLSLNGTCFQEEKIDKIREAKNDQTSVFCFYSNKALLAYLFGSYAEANQYAIQAHSWTNAVTGLPELTTFTFYDTLIAFAYYKEAANDEKKSILKRAVKNVKKLHKWATYGPQNYQHKYLLANAEYLRVRGKFLQAAMFYDQAANAARKHQYMQEEALAYEKAGSFYQERGDTNLAAFYVGKAWEAYKQWGSESKLVHLEKTYPFITSNRITETTATPVFSSSTNIDHLDLASVLKAAMAISSE
ncbi:MAG: serine/threonine-protein kinase PknK, partial [Flavisolibacter sp.]|nr:serine/threonine-protein kinase PknK [Flavisolibacter sp.]